MASRWFRNLEITRTAQPFSFALRLSNSNRSMRLERLLRRNSPATCSFKTISLQPFVHLFGKTIFYHISIFEISLLDRKWRRAVNSSLPLRESFLFSFFDRYWRFLVRRRALRSKNVIVKPEMMKKKKNRNSFEMIVLRFAREVKESRIETREALPVDVGIVHSVMRSEGGEGKWGRIRVRGVERDGVALCGNC